MIKKLKISPESAKEILKGNAKTCIASDDVMVNGNPITIMERVTYPDFPEYSGWTFLSGYEIQEDLDNVNQSGQYPLNLLANYDEKIIKFLGAPTGRRIVFDENNTPNVTHN